MCSAATHQLHVHEELAGLRPASGTSLRSWASCRCAAPKLFQPFHWRLNHQPLVNCREHLLDASIAHDARMARALSVGYAEVGARGCRSTPCRAAQVGEGFSDCGSVSAAALLLPCHAGPIHRLKLQRSCPPLCTSPWRLFGGWRGQALLPPKLEWLWLLQVAGECV